MPYSRLLIVHSALLLCLAAASISAAPPRTVHFLSEDHTTTLVAYLFEPEGPGPHPAVVLLHGRAGAYSSLAQGVYNATTLSKRHVEWATFWAARNYVAIVVDSFGPRGYPAGFPEGSHKDRPPAVSEETVRPFDAYGALAYLRKRADISKDRIGVQGWSNGGMTVLVSMSDRSPGLPLPAHQPGFRAAIAEYPGCGMDSIKGDYHAYAPMLMMIAGNDQEVSPKRCEQFGDKAQAAGNDLTVKVYDGASHNFDDPSKTKQSVPANHKATEDALRRAEAFFADRILR